MHSTIRQLVPMWGINRRSKCVLVRYHRARSFSSSQYVKTKRQDKLRPKAHPCFSLDLRQTAPVIPMRCFSLQEVLFTLATSHGRGYLLQPLLLQKMCILVSVSRKGGKLDPSRYGDVEVDQDVDRDESSEYTEVRPRVTASLVVPTPARGCPMREGSTGGWPTYRRGYFIERCRHERDSGYTRAQQRGYSGGFAMATPQQRPGSTRLGSLPAPAHRSNRRHLFLRRTRWMIALRLSWEGGLPTS